MYMDRSKFVVWFIVLSMTELFASDNEFLLRTESLPADVNFLPTLSNGHLGYTVFGNAIYMNGVYNGYGGNSRRGRIPNWLNLSTAIVHDDDSNHRQRTNEISSVYEMDLHDGYFRCRESIPSMGLELEQRTYAHRFYNRALIYELLVHRTETKARLKLKLTQSPGDPSEAFSFTPLSVDGVGADLPGKDGQNNESKWKMVKGTTKFVENELFQKQPTTVFVILSEDLEQGKLLEMAEGQGELYYQFILTADENVESARLEMATVQSLKPAQLLELQKTEWNNFWMIFNIQIKNNTELSQVINAGIFYIASSLPSQNSFQPNKEFYGLSPTGLGRGELDADYEGHNFWDTEIWMLPVIAQFSDEWARQLLGYRERCLPGAQYNARLTGYKGARYPWESAYTGTEVTNPAFPEVAANQVHITADIAIAFKQYFAITNDLPFLCENARPVLYETSDFLIDRVKRDPITKKYHILNVMGPDEDHENIDDSVYTNLSFKIALEFASFVERFCTKSGVHHYAWKDVADNLIIPYDSVLNYHPEYSNYRIGEEVKQADAILLGYPLQYPINASTRLNDLLIYEAVTRDSGPAMTWSMFSINYLDVNETTKADYYFSKSYKDYFRKEFKVWSEVQVGYNGAANFLTGIGGFLQAIINGYAGLRFYCEEGKSVLKIQRRYVLPGSEGFRIHGLRFAGSVFELSVESNGFTEISCISAGEKRLELVKEHENYQIFKGFSVQLKTQSVIIQTMAPPQPESPEHGEDKRHFNV